MLKYYCANISLIEEQEVFDEWLGKMNKQRREKVLRCKNKNDKCRSLLAGILLRNALEREGISYEDEKFGLNCDGKPILLTHPEIHFSISHSENYVGCIISDRTVGVDLEYSKKSLFLDGNEKRLEAVAKKCLSQAEWEQFSKNDIEKKKKLFLEYWTKKESFSKAMGKGLKMKFSQIDTESNAKDYWTVWTTDGYCVSIYISDGEYEELLIEKQKSL